MLQKETDIGDHETLPELYSRLAKLGANMLMETFENLPELLESAMPQNEENVTYGMNAHLCNRKCKSECTCC